MGDTCQRISLERRILPTGIPRIWEEISAPRSFSIFPAILVRSRVFRVSSGEIPDRGLGDTCQSISLERRILPTGIPRIWEEISAPRSFSIFPAILVRSRVFRFSSGEIPDRGLGDTCQSISLERRILPTGIPRIWEEISAPRSLTYRVDALIGLPS